MKPTRTWILIADGAQARIARNDGPGRGVTLAHEETFHGRNEAGRDIMADRPGRTFDSAGEGRHAKEPHSDPREVEKRRFLREMVTLLDEAAKRDSFDRLVLVAPPKALGLLRNELSETLRKRLDGELDKDLTQVPVHELARHLGDLIPV